MNPKNLDEIVKLARRQLELEQLVDDLEAAVADQKKALRQIQEVDLPLAMAEVGGLASLSLDSGEKITIKKEYSIGINAPARDAAFEWLEKKGYGGMIKTSVIAEFGRGELQKAIKLTDKLAKEKLSVSMKRNVHPQTLKAWYAERVASADRIPQDLFGADSWDKSIITPPKRKDD